MSQVTRTERNLEGLNRPSASGMLEVMWIEGRIRDLAASQHGLVSRPQLMALGVSDDNIVWRIASGRIVPLHPGVYYLDSVTLTWKSQVLAGIFAAGSAALATHRTAAVLWGFDAIFGRMIEVTVPYNEEPESQGVILHRTRRTNPETIVDAIPITSPEKTILDLAPILPESVLIKAARSAVRADLTSPEKMDLAVGLYGGRGVSGTRKTRRVIRIVSDDQSGSVAEIDLKEIVMSAPVPRPIQQLQIGLPDGSNAYPDFAWPDRMRIVEVDGFEAHGTPEQLQRDLRRQNQLMELGWEIRRFTATDVRARPQEVKNEVVHFVNKPFCEG
jgi:hypothetical protein